MLIKKIGQGSYGTVVRARHIPTGNMVAIKKIQNVFANVCDAKRLLREILILKSIGFHQNIANRTREVIRSDPPKASLSLQV